MFNDSNKYNFVGSKNISLINHAKENSIKAKEAKSFLSFVQIYQQSKNINTALPLK